MLLQKEDERTANEGEDIDRKWFMGTGLQPEKFLEATSNSLLSRPGHGKFFGFFPILMRESWDCSNDDRNAGSQKLMITYKRIR